MTGSRTESTRPMQALRLLAALGSVLLAPVAFRGLLILERTAGVSTADFRGLLSDLAVSGVVVLLAFLATRRSRVLGALLVAGWCVAQYANYEIVSALGSLASVSDAHFLGSPAFLFGSALAVSRPGTLAGSIVVSVALALWALPRLRAPAAGGIGAVAAIAFAVQGLWPWSYEMTAWRQTHFLAHDVVKLARGWASPESPLSRFRDAPAAMIDLVPSLASDLSGTPRTRLGTGRYNVLLVILESVSGIHMKSLASDHGMTVPSLMPKLDQIARESLSFSTFYVHQRRTNKGLYAILCGELPNLKDALPKMSAYTEGGRVCLPEALRRAGYHTVYLQAAPLAFMLKDQFMARAGFEEVLGDAWSRDSYARTAWGVDDRAFLEQSLVKIRELEASEKPWFLTLLTVGTHHPYVVPHDYRPRIASNVSRSFHYADDAVHAFDEAIAEMGLRGDTLVIYTSDESLGFDGTIRRIDQLILKGWGFLIVRSPQQLRGRVREPFAQMDLATSILDYLGLEDRGGHFFGRSVFRSYENPRPMFFSNSNSDFNAVVHSDGHLAMCLLNFENCRSYRVPDGRVFGPQRTRIPWDPEVDGVLREMADRSVGAVPVSNTREFRLIDTPSFGVDQSEAMLVHGGQYVTLGEGDWIEVDLEIEARGEGEVELHHFLRYPPGQYPYNHSVRLAGGETLFLRYSFAPPQAVADLDARTTARMREGSAMELHFTEARMIVHRTGKPPGSGLQVARDEVVQQSPSR